MDERGGIGGSGLDGQEPTVEALGLLIEGEQKLLAVFDARQASADAKLTAAVTGALALPAAALALHRPLNADEGLLKWGYAIVVALVAILFLLRTYGGWLRRREPTPNEPGRKSKKTISAESEEAAAARDAWWGCEGTADPITVQEYALALWRTRAQHSRHIAQVKDIIAVVGGCVFVIALALMVVLVAVA